MDSISKTVLKLMAILLLSPFSWAFAQAPNYIFRHITTENGLASNNVISCIQDSKGIIWISTTKGLQKFDGNSFVTYRHDPADKNSLRTDEGVCLLEDNEKNIWLSQWPWGFSRFDPQSGKSDNINHIAKDESKKSLTVSVGACKDPEGNIWLCSNDLIARYDIKTHQLKYFPNSIPGHAGLDGYISYDAGTRKIWLSSYYYGVCMFDPVKQVLYNRVNNPYHDPAFNIKQPVGAMLLDRENTLWVSTYLSDLYKCNLITGKWEQVFINNKAEPRLGSISKQKKGNLIITCITEDHGGNIWFGVSKCGLLEYSHLTKKICLIKKELPNQVTQGLNYYENISGIFEDKDANLWIATDNGLFVFNPGSQKFNSVDFSSYPKLPDTRYDVLNCLERENGDIWVATWGGGIFVFDRFMHFKKRYVSDMVHPSNPHCIGGQKNMVWSFLELPDSTILIGSQRGWLSLYNPKTDRFTNFQPDSLKDLTIINMFLDNEKNVWMALYNGIAKWNRKENKFYRVDNFPDFEGLTGGTVANDIVEDGKKNIWIATLDRGLQEFDPSSGKFIREFVPEKNNPFSISSSLIHSITIIDKERIALSTDDGGINIFNTKNRRFYSITTKDGMPSNNVYALYFEAPVDLWAATDNGICKVDIINKKISWYGSRDGIPAYDFDGLSHFCKLRNGDLLAGYAGGIVRFNPNNISPKQPPNDVIITGLNVFDKKLPVDSILSSGGAKFSYKQNFISVQYVSLDYLLTNPIHYYYQLEGIDKDWINAGEREVAYYTNLPEGNYIFKVRCARDDGMVSKNITSFTISISPPFWQTWWFYVVAILAVVIVLYLIYRYRINEIKRMQFIRNKISRDLHDDLGATLSSISVLSEVARDNLEKGSLSESYPLLSKINNYSREMVDKMRDIIWAINPSNDSSENLILRLKTYCADACTSKEINLKFIVDENFRNKAISMNDRKNIYLICKEAIHNAISHSGCRDIEVKFDASEPQLIIEVSDNGGGFTRTKNNSGNGLINMEARAKEINAKLVIYSGNSGTRILLRSAIPRIRDFKNGF